METIGKQRARVDHSHGPLVIVARATICWAALLLAAPLGAAPPVPDILYYRFDGSGSSVVNHASAPPAGTATATIVGSALSQGVPFNTVSAALGGSGAAAETNYVDTGWATNLSGSWTISFFARNVPADGSNHYVFGDVTAGSLRCFVVGGLIWQLVGANYAYGDMPVFAPDGGLHMITYVYDQPNGRTAGYLDAAFNSSHVAQPFSITGSGPFTVGAYRGTPGSGNLGLNGQMIDFRLYSRALSLSEIRTLYAFVTTDGDAIFSDGFEL